MSAEAKVKFSFSSKKCLCNEYGQVKNTVGAIITMGQYDMILHAAETDYW